MARSASPGTRILLAGGTGQVGRHLARALKAVGKTIAPGRATLDLASIESVRGVIRDTRPDVIVNAAGITNVDHAEIADDDLHAVNALAPGVMAEEARRSGALLVHFSSVYVFDGTLSRPYTESDPPHPVNAYGRSKLAAEQAIVATGAAALILRASWVYDVQGRNFLVTMLRLAMEHETLRVVDDQTGSPAWARPMAEAIAALLRDLPRAREARGIYNLAAPTPVTRHDFVQRALEIGRERAAPFRATRLERIRTADFPLPAARPLNSALDTSKLRATFGIELPQWDAQLSACLAALGERTPDRRVSTRW